MQIFRGAGASAYNSDQRKEIVRQVGGTSFIQPFIHIEKLFLSNDNNAKRTNILIQGGLGH